MDRTAEFRSFLKVSKTERHSATDKFYESLYKSIAEASGQAKLPGSYKSLLVLENKVEDLRRKASLLLDAIKVEGPKDVQMHFDGIKHIISNAIINATRTIASAKDKTVGAKVSLAPEQPNIFKEQNIDLESHERPSAQHEKSLQAQILEKENKDIVRSTQYEATRQRLLKIEVVQKAIQENLALQDERIDNICTASDTTGNIYRSLSTDDGIGRGSLIRRALFVMIICLSCVLVFLHLYYRK